MSITGGRPDDSPMESAAPEFRIRPASESDIPAIVALLADAFQSGDPISEWIFPDQRRRLRGQHRMLTELLRHRYLPVGGAEVAVSGGRIVGVSLYTRSWHKPSMAHLIIGDLALLRALRSRVFAAMAVDAALATVAPAGRHICLVYLACESSWEGKGVGTDLYKSLFAKSVEAGCEAYGITKPGNVAYYASILDGLGVLDEVVFSEVTIGRHGPTLKAMRCRPHY